MFLVTGLYAQGLRKNAADIAQGLTALKAKGSVLYIAAHPDDENTRLLSYFSQGLHLKTAYLSLTRGDGGQNLIGNEQAELLGLIRTQELLAARRVDGAAQYFTRANDFGFSKTPEETFEVWGKEAILSDIVWVIRNFQPDLIITRFPEDARAGHGHHSGSAILAREAFFAAADPKRFPEQLQYVKPWKAERLLWNTFNFGGTNTTAAGQLQLEVGAFNPFLGYSYGEIAAISRTNHKSQGFGSTLQRGNATEYFSHLAGTEAKNSIFEGLVIQQPLQELNSIIDQLLASFNPQEPQLLLRDLLQLRKKTKDIHFNHRLLDELILASAGIWIEALSPESTYAVGDEVPFTVHAILRQKLPLPVSVRSENQQVTLPYNQTQQLLLTTKASDENLSQPYWLAKGTDGGHFIVDDLLDIGHAENPHSLKALVQVTLEDQLISLQLPLSFRSTDPIRGELYRPVVIAPPVTASLPQKAYVFNGQEAVTVPVQLKGFTGGVKGQVRLTLFDDWKVSPESVNFELKQKGEEKEILFSVIPGKKGNHGHIEAEISMNGRFQKAKGYKTIHYEHIPPITLFPPAIAKAERTHLLTGGKRIAYIEGAGDMIPESLIQVGYQVTRLQPVQAISSDLTVYDAVVTGVRLYNIYADVAALHQKLMDYTEKGGVVLIQYNVNNGLKSSILGPYPFKIINKRVTEENAPVKVLLPTHPSMLYPNKITAADFQGWVQERGLYFAAEIDSRYSLPLSMSDKGEEASSGALLIAPYGKGKFVYTSLAFFRELPAGVSGAYRLFANLLATPPLALDKRN